MPVEEISDQKPSPITGRWLFLFEGKNMNLFWRLIFFITCFSGAACFAQDKTVELTVMTHDSFSISKTLMTEFENNHGISVRFIKAGDAGAVLNQAILSKSNPMADVFFGVDNTFLSRALTSGIFIPYSSPLLSAIPNALRLDPENRLLPVDFGDVCLNYDKNWFSQKGIPTPERLEDLLKPEYTGLTVVENPATSSPGLAFLLTTVGHFGETGYIDFWKKLKANDVLAVDGWKQAYWGNFSASSKGNRPIVVSYAGSPAAEVWFSKKPLSQAPTAAVTTDGTCFRQIEFVGILKGTRHLELAQKLVDFMLDKPFQEDIPLQMFVFPANSTAKLPEVFVQNTQTTRRAVEISPQQIDAGREKWIDAWTDAVLR
jgi:thiamine transport system substrate-binding protein